MKRVVEFDLVTKSEPNQRFASTAGMFAKAARTKAQREAVRAVLRSSLGSPPPLHVVQVGDRFEPVGAVGMAVRNTIAVTLTRIAPGLLDAFENLPAALKAIVDEVAAWCGPKDNDPIYTWKAEQRKSEAGIYRVELAIVDKLTGADRVVRLAETRSAGVEAERRVKRAITKATKKPQRDGPCGCGATGLGLRGFHYPGASGCAKPTVRDLHAAAERLLVPPRDPGSEQAARELADCTTCAVRAPHPCKKRVPGRMVFGVHVARAIAAGLHVPDDDRAKVKPARALRGPRKLVPAARPAGQAVLPILAAWCALPWEQAPCASCDLVRRIGGDSLTEAARLAVQSRCPTCGGTGRAKGRVLTRAARYDGLDEPPTTITASVPAEHVQRYGSTVTLTRQKFTSGATGPCWVYATTDERTTT